MAEDKIHVAWLSGGYHRRSAMMHRIRERFSSFEYVVIDSTRDFEYLMSKIRSGGCFNEGRLISVTGIPSTKNANSKKKYIKRLEKILEGTMENCFLVFNGVSEKKEKAIFNAVKDYAKFYEFESVIPSREVGQYVAKRMKANKLWANGEIYSMLAEYCGKIPNSRDFNSDKIEMALLSLSLSMPENSEVTKDHILNITFQYDEFIIWDMMNALDAKDCEQVTHLLSKMQVGDKPINQSITEMFTTLVWRYRLILLIIEGYSSKQSREEIIKNALSMRKMTKTGVGIDASYEPALVKTGANAGNPASVWSQQVISIAMDGMYGSEPSVDKWTRGQIYVFVNALTSSLSFLRGATGNESLLIADTVLMLGCGILSRNDADIILDSFKELRENYA